MRQGRAILLLLTIFIIAGAFGGLWYVRGFISGVAPLVRGSPVLSDALPFALGEGFAASIFARGVPGARVITRDPKGALVVTLTSEGRVVALPDLDGNGKADRTVTILEGQNAPHGIAYVCPQTGNESADQDSCQLFVAETDAVNAYGYDSDTYTATYKKTLLTLPQSGGHSTRSLLAHPDGRQLLVAVGSSCNVCIERDLRRASILSIDLTTGSVKPYATGLRNTVFMAIHPVTGEIWGTDMGRDLLGDDVPPDEVNIIREGGNYGWPICYGKNIHDADFDKNTYIRNPCMEPFEQPSQIDIPAHSAPLGIAFIPEEGWPEEYWHDILVAYHGSWNRSVPTGYKIVRIDEHGIATDFMTGFMDGGEVLGRPVGLLVEPGGALYISDDRAGVIYKVARTSME